MWDGNVDLRLLGAAARGRHHVPVLANPHDPRLLLPPQELHRRYEGAPESAKTKALQTVIEMKASVLVFVREQVCL